MGLLPVCKSRRPSLLSPQLLSLYFFSTTIIIATHLSCLVFLMWATCHCLITTFSRQEVPRRAYSYRVGNTSLPQVLFPLPGGPRTSIFLLCGQHITASSTLSLAGRSLDKHILIVWATRHCLNFSFSHQEVPEQAYQPSLSLYIPSQAMSSLSRLAITRLVSFLLSFVSSSFHSPSTHWVFRTANPLFFVSSSLHHQPPGSSAWHISLLKPVGSSMRQYSFIKPVGSSTRQNFSTLIPPGLPLSIALLCQYPFFFQRHLVFPVASSNIILSSVLKLQCRPLFPAASFLCHPLSTLPSSHQLQRHLTFSPLSHFVNIVSSSIITSFTVPLPFTLLSAFYIPFSPSFLFFFCLCPFLLNLTSTSASSNNHFTDRHWQITSCFIIAS
jgi:hypothetical protein